MPASPLWRRWLLLSSSASLTEFLRRPRSGNWLGDLIWPTVATDLKGFAVFQAPMTADPALRVRRGCGLRSRRRHVRVVDFPLHNPALMDRAVSRPAVDIGRCTRCHSPWGFELVEDVEMWRCGQCGYEAREKSSDFAQLLTAAQEALLS